MNVSKFSIDILNVTEDICISNLITPVKYHRIWQKLIWALFINSSNPILYRSVTKKQISRNFCWLTLYLIGIEMTLKHERCTTKIKEWRTFIEIIIFDNQTEDRQTLGSWSFRCATDVYREIQWDELFLDFHPFLDSQAGRQNTRSPSTKWAKKAQKKKSQLFRRLGRSLQSRRGFRD